MEHIHTAVSMYKAGKVLRDRFCHYDIGTEDEKAQKISTIIPLVIVYIFGIEVGLKAIIKQQGLKPKRTHDLRKLYENLSPVVQETIEDKVRASGSNMPEVKHLLTEHRDSLQEWRYPGDVSHPLVVDLDALAATLRALIETHTEQEGPERKLIRTPREHDAPPQSIVDAATEYQRNVFRPDAREGTS